MIARIACIAAALLGISSAGAQSYPVKPVRILHADRSGPRVLPA